MSFSKAKILGLAFKGKPATIVDLSKPIVSMTPAEQEFADSVIHQHFSEEHNEIINQSDTLILIAERSKTAKQPN